MRGTVLQVNVSRGGVPKRPLLQGYLTPAGVDGDAFAHPAIHGGPRQAVLLIASEVVDELRLAGWPVSYGALGENLTTAGLSPAAWRAGQRYRAGEALLELTTPREPCATLNVYGRGIQRCLFDRAVKQGRHESPLWGRGGFYAAVVQPGWVRPGDAIELE